MAISAKDVQKLREMTGAGMMDCKKALEESNGDFDKAAEILRKKGAKAAEKRSDREANEGFIANYVHNGRVGVLLELNSETDFVAKNSDFKDLAKDLALQVAAMTPKYISKDEVPKEEVDKELEIEREKLQKEGKPADILEKILEGKIQKYYNEVCLLNQSFFKDDKKTIQDLINENVSKIGERIEITRFVRLEIGKDTIVSSK